MPFMQCQQLEDFKKEMVNSCHHVAHQNSFSSFFFTKILFYLVIFSIYISRGYSIDVWVFLCLFLLQLNLVSSPIHTPSHQGWLSYQGIFEECLFLYFLASDSERFLNQELPNFDLDKFQLFFHLLHFIIVSVW